MAALTRSKHTTYCPYKGDASYYDIPAGGDRFAQCGVTYETPFDAMAQIKDYVAFYPDRVDEISMSERGVRAFSAAMTIGVLNGCQGSPIAPATNRSNGIASSAS